MFTFQPTAGFLKFLNLSPVKTFLPPSAPLPLLFYLLLPSSYYNSSLIIPKASIFSYLYQFNLILSTILNVFFYTYGLSPPTPYSYSSSYILFNLNAAISLFNSFTDSNYFHTPVRSL